MNNNLSLQTADILAKKMISTLLCPACKDACLRTDGSVKGRLRLVCNHCRKTLYADKHPLIVDILILSAGSTENVQNTVDASIVDTLAQSQTVRTQSGTPKVLSGGTMASTMARHNSHKSTDPCTSDPETEYLSDDSLYPSLTGTNSPMITTFQPKQPNVVNTVPYIDDPMNTENCMVPIQDEINLRNMEEIEALKDNVNYLSTGLNDNNMAIQEIKSVVTKLSDQLAKFLPLIQSLCTKISMPSTANNSNAVMKSNSTNAQYHLTSRSLNSTAQQYPSQDNSINTIDPVSPWLVAARKGKKVPAPQYSIKMSNGNRYNDLSESIPAYKKLIESTETSTLQRPSNIKPRTPKYRDMTPEDIERVKQGRPLRQRSSMVHLYFEGFKRNRPTDIKNTLKCIGIPLSNIRNISFIGSSIMELLTFNDVKDMIIEKLAGIKVTNIPNFNPLSTENIKDSNKFAKVSTEDEKKVLAKKLYISRLRKTLERIPVDPKNNRLRNYYAVLIKQTDTQESTEQSTSSPQEVLTQVPSYPDQHEISTESNTSTTTNETNVSDIPMEDITKKRKDRSDDESQDDMRLGQNTNVESA